MHYRSTRLDNLFTVTPSCDPNSDSLRDLSISSFKTIASWLEVSTSYLEVLRIFMPIYCASALLSTTRDCLERPVTPSRERPSGDQETSPLVAPPREVLRKLGMYFIANAFSAGPEDAMIALRENCQQSATITREATLTC
jgi:hypothetical protein